MQLSKELFWDVNYDTIDWGKNYQWVICRVLEYGKMVDWHEMKKHYGVPKIIESAINARSLSIKTVHFIHHIYEVPLEKFRCYSSMHSDPIHWMY